MTTRLAVVVALVALAGVWMVATSPPANAGTIPPVPVFKQGDSGWMTAKWTTWGSKSGGSRYFEPNQFDHDGHLQDPVLAPRGNTPDDWSLQHAQNDNDKLYDIIALNPDGQGIDTLVITAYNFEKTNPLKRIWIELEWRDFLPDSNRENDWKFEVTAKGTMSSGGQTTQRGSAQYSGYKRMKRPGSNLDDEWVSAYWYLELEPNPQYEDIIVRASRVDGRKEALWIREVRLTTQCSPIIPEPSSMLLMALGLAAGACRLRSMRG